MAWARFGAMTAYDALAVVDDVDQLTEGFWAVVIDFESSDPDRVGLARR